VADQLSIAREEVSALSESASCSITDRDISPRKSRIGPWYLRLSCRLNLPSLEVRLLFALRRDRIFDWGRGWGLIKSRG